MRYLIEPENHNFPDFLNEQIEKLYNYQTHEGDPRAFDRPELVREKIRSIVQHATLKERFPIFELMLEIGDPPISEQKGYPQNIIEQYLKIPPKSEKSTLIESYLEIIPSDERAGTLAYLIGNKNDKSNGLKPIFEVFQTVGIKAGQLGSLWQLFGPEVSQELASLKDKATPMTKAEILDVIGNTMSTKDRVKVKKIKKILGAASLKTVVLVELSNGSHAVLAVQRPYAAEQIKNHLARAELLINKLISKGFKIENGLLESMKSSVENQLMTELNMKVEAKNMQKAYDHYQKMNVTLKDKLNGWEFQVPRVHSDFEVYENVFLAELGGSDTFESLKKKVSPDIHNKLGEVIVESSLRGLFEEGFFDPDRHLGNFLFSVDKEGKGKIFPIDFGQAQSYKQGWRWGGNDSYNLAQFFRFLKQKNIPELVKFALRMTDSKSISREAKLSLMHDLTMLIHTNGDVKSQLTELVTIFSRHHVPLSERFAFGAFKGLLVLQNENYVSGNVFSHLIEEAVTRTLTQKHPIRSIVDEPNPHVTFGMSRSRCMYNRTLEYFGVGR